MSDFIIKGTVVGFTAENWITDAKLFSSTLITVMNTWSDNESTIDEELLNARHNLLKASYGEVKQAVIAMDNDIHNLSVCYNQIIRDLRDENLKGGMRSLFIGNLVENYFTNLRSIYDHMATFPRIVCDESYLKQGLLKTTSFNSLLSLVEKNAKIQVAISDGVVWAIDQCRENFEVIKALRDAIIHQGKEPVITVSESRQIFFKVPKNVGIYSSDDLVPSLLKSSLKEQELLPFLQLITKRLLVDMEKLGNTIAEIYFTEERKQKGLMLYALTGICMQRFIEFLFPTGRTEEFYRSALQQNRTWARM